MSTAIHPNKGKKLPPEPLTSNESHALVKACNRRAPVGRRNAAMISVMLRCGLRVSEVVGLDLRDLDLDGAMLNIRHGKGNKHRTVGVDPGTLAMIECWLQVYRASEGPLFGTLNGGRLKTAYVREMVPRMGRRAGIEKRVHPHGLRHTFAVGLAERNIPVPVISKALGHANTAVTAKYLDHVRPQDVIDAMRAIEW